MVDLVHDGRALAPVEVARGPLARGRGLLGRDRIDGVLVLRAVSVHSVGLRCTIDVACCRPVPGPIGGSTLLVVAVLSLAPGRITRPRLGARVVLEAAAGSFGRWGVGPGAVLRLRD